MLFADERKLKLTVPTRDTNSASTNVGWLVSHLCTEVMKDPRKELFVLDGHVCVCFSFRASYLCPKHLIVHSPVSIQLVRVQRSVSFLHYFCT
jgi:hypothetical protein